MVARDIETDDHDLITPDNGSVPLPHGKKYQSASMYFPSAKKSSPTGHTMSHLIKRKQVQSSRNPQCRVSNQH